MNILIKDSNWRRLWIAAFYVAAKTWEDLANWNIDFISRLGEKYTLQNMYIFL